MQGIIDWLTKGGQGKTYLLAGVLAVAFWAKTVGLLPEDVYTTLAGYIAAIMTGTVGLKLVRPS